jgi:hypothetical protein
MASASNASETETKPPFVLRKLELYFLGDNNETTSKQRKEKYRYLKERDYSCGASFLHNPVVSLEDFDQAEEDGSEPDSGDDEPEEENEWSVFSELIELSDDECVSHYNRILRGDFPWKEFNKLVLRANES